LINFDNITPEDIIGNGVRGRDWKIRGDEEKPCWWHFHISGDDVHACVTGVRGDSEDEAADAALDEFFWAKPEIDPGSFFNTTPNWTYCTTASCACLPVHVVRMQDRRPARPGPVIPTVLMFDLIWRGRADHRGHVRPRCGRPGRTWGAISQYEREAPCSNRECRGLGVIERWAQILTLWRGTVQIRIGHGDQAQIVEESILVRAPNEPDARESVIRWLPEEARKLMRYGRICINLNRMPKSKGADQLRVGQVYRIE
jgi:hypothetical protein